MGLTYKIDGKLVPLESGQAAPKDSALVKTFDKGEFEKLDGLIDTVARKDIEALLVEESCYASVYPNYVIGSLAIPDKEDAMGKRELLAFYWEPDLLIFIDEGHIAAKTLDEIAATQLPVNSVATCMQMFLEELLFNDTTWLGEFEDRLEAVEEGMLKGTDKVTWKEITAFRRVTIRMSTYYEQLAEMASVLYSNDNNMMTEEESSGFKSIITRIDRLLRRAEAIREHSLALRELHQTQIGVQQNNTMQLLTVVTIIIAPLQLATAWFGMNFDYLPGASEPLGLPVMCIVVAVLTLLLIFWFRKKRWI